MKVKLPVQNMPKINTFISSTSQKIVKNYITKSHLVANSESSILYQPNQQQSKCQLISQKSSIKQDKETSLSKDSELINTEIT